MRHPLLALPAALIVAFSCWSAELPRPFATESSTNRPRVVPQPKGAQLHVPTGFNIELFAEGFEQARYMTLGPSNEVLLSDSKGGTVYILKPQRKKLIENLDRPYGLAFWKDYLYVGETTSVKRYKYNAKQMTVGAGEEVLDTKSFAKGHWTRAVLFDRAGQKMYVGIGSASNVDAGEDPKRAAINRFNPDGSGHEIFATGTRNPTAIHFYPGTDTLWVSVQERDALGDDLVPDYLTSVKQGGFYGWPFSYIGPHVDPRRAVPPVTNPEEAAQKLDFRPDGTILNKATKKPIVSEKPDLVSKTIVPDHIIGAHRAVIDFEFYTGKMFPPEYQGGAFLALHGSWNRSKRVGQVVAFVPFKDGKPSGPQQDFLTGWLISPDSTDVWGRPVGLLQMPDGSLLVSEDGNNRVFRISYKGK